MNETEAVGRIPVQETEKPETGGKAPRIRDLDSLPRRRILNCSFDELVETSWDKAWRPDS